MVGERAQMFAYEFGKDRAYARLLPGLYGE
jgi:hypothetical protein